MSCACPKALWCGSADISSRCIRSSSFQVAVLACKVPVPLCVLLRRGLEATGPSGSVGGVTSHSTLVPNHRCSWVGHQVPVWTLVRPDQASEETASSTAEHGLPISPLLTTCEEVSRSLKTCLKLSETAIKSPKIGPKIAENWAENRRNSGQKSTKIRPKIDENWAENRQESVFLSIKICQRLS